THTDTDASISPRLAQGVRRVKEWGNQCWCSMKMSPPNCSVKMSSPHGDFYDEQEGSAARGARQSSPGRQDHEPGGRASVASERAAVQAAQGPLPARGCAGLGASSPRPALRSQETHT